MCCQSCQSTNVTARPSFYVLWLEETERLTTGSAFHNDTILLK